MAPQMGFLITCDPSNINHIFNTNFPNYPKGKEFAETFDILRDGILGTDCQRKLAQSIFCEADLRSVHERVSRDKVEERLVPFLEDMANEQRPFDLQDVFVRLTSTWLATRCADSTFAASPSNFQWCRLLELII